MVIVERPTDRLTDRQTDRPTDRRTDEQTNRRTDEQANRRTCEATQRKDSTSANKEMKKQKQDETGATHRQTSKQTSTPLLHCTHTRSGQKKDRVLQAHSQQQRGEQPAANQEAKSQWHLSPFSSVLHAQTGAIRFAQRNCTGPVAARCYSEAPQQRLARPIAT